MKELPVLLVTDGVLMPGIKMRIPVRTSTNINMIENCLLNKNDYDNGIIIAYRQDANSKKAFPVGTYAKIDQIVCWSTNNSRVQYSLHVYGINRVEIFNINGFTCRFKILYNVCSDNLTLQEENEFLESIKKLMLLIVNENKHSLKHLKELLTDISHSQFDELTDVCMTLIPDVSYVEQLTFLAELNVAKKMKIITDLISKLAMSKSLEMIDVNDRRIKQNEYALEKIKKSKLIMPNNGKSLKRHGEDELWNRIEAAKISNGPVLEAVVAEYEKYKSLPSSSQEHYVLRSYLEYIADLPWSVSTTDKNDINDSKSILEAEHEGMKDVKKRILEFLAVKKLKKDLKGPILCLTGPPGVGKTSIAKSIAKTLGRKFQRISLGGIRDQSDIRGHRRTYVGAMPGRIIHAIKTAKSNNPVILLDEIDKLGIGPHGDPSSALLEVLDPEQNNTFTDLYLNLPFDLSKILFIATANDIKNISLPLLDRMEIIEMSSYSIIEKHRIARNHIIPRQVRRHALLPEYVTFDDSSITTMIEYTNEAGVRQLERVIGAICRNVALRVAESINGENLNADVISKKFKLPILIDAKEIDIILKNKNKKRKDSSIAEIKNSDECGVVFGLAWTPIGGEVLVIEAVLSTGSEKTIFTGNLGNVIKESIQVAQSVIKHNANIYELDLSKFDKSQLHIHLPAGAIGKDGPSAGCAFTVAIFSTISDKKVRKDSAVTGEMTLTGKILPVGGIKEKILAAHRNEIFRIILPKANEIDIRELEKNILDLMEIVFVDNVHELLFEMIDGPMPKNISNKNSQELYSKM